MLLFSQIKNQKSSSTAKIKNTNPYHITTLFDGLNKRKWISQIIDPYLNQWWIAYINFFQVRNWPAIQGMLQITNLVLIQWSQCFCLNRKLQQAATSAQSPTTTTTLPNLDVVKTEDIKPAITSPPVLIETLGNWFHTSHS